MICAFCKNEIESDSFFCDQCGKEVKVCPQCGTPGKGKICTEHGKKLISAKERNEQKEPSGQPVKTPDVKTEKLPEEEPALAATTRFENQQEPVKNSGTPELRFVNNAIKYNLGFQDGDIVGRKKGRFTEKFFQYKQISGGHAKISFDGTHWHITDLDSSNGTKHNGENLPANVPRKLVNNDRVILANIEFIVQVSAPDDGDDDKTIRL